MALGMEVLLSENSTLPLPPPPKSLRPHQGLAEAVLGQARWGLVGHTAQKIFKIKLVTTCLR